MAATDSTRDRYPASMPGRQAVEYPKTPFQNSLSSCPCFPSSTEIDSAAMPSFHALRKVHHEWDRVLIIEPSAPAVLISPLK